MEDLPNHSQQEVLVTRVSLVKPAKPTVRHTMYLSGVDHMIRLVRPSRTILFYRSCKDPADAHEALRQGLASTLVAFYPMAGRLLLQEDGRLAIDCNDEGVHLILAHSHLPFAELERDNFHIRPLFRQLVPLDGSETSIIMDDAFASIQVTTFLGGFTVGIAISHLVADGHSVWTFIRAIAEACRGDPPSISPLHARILLKPEVFMMGTSFPDEDVAKSNAAPYSGCTVAVRASNVAPEVLEQKVIIFSKEMLETLKRICVSSAAAGSYVSTYQALAAYLWKRLTMAQRLDEEASVDFRVSMDVRNRMIPPLTLAYFGNAVVGVPTPTTAGELTNESLGDTAARIRQSIHQVNDIYIKKAFIAREKVNLANLGLSSVQLTVIRNATGFPVYEAGNFGWGEPDAVRPPWDWREGDFTWYPGKNPESIEVCVSLTHATCTNFFSPHLYPNDPLFGSSFPFLCTGPK